MHFQYSGQTLHHSALCGCSTLHQPRGDIPLPPGLPIWGLLSEAWTQSPPPLSPCLHLQAHKPQGKVERTKGQASLALEPQDQLRDRVSLHPPPPLYRPGAKAQRGWGGRAGSHSILFRPGVLPPRPQVGLLPPDQGKWQSWALSPSLQIFFCMSLRKVCLILALIWPLALSGSHWLSLSSLFCLFHPLVPMSLSDSYAPTALSCLASLLALRVPVFVHPCLPDFVLGAEIRGGVGEAVPVSRRGPLGWSPLPPMLALRKESPHGP